MVSFFKKKPEFHSARNINSFNELKIQIKSIGILACIYQLSDIKQVISARMYYSPQVWFLRLKSGRKMAKLQSARIEK